MTIAETEVALAAWLDLGVNHERGGTFAAIGLERISAFLRHLPTPPAPLTVAGTKGKGSTVRLVEAALRAHGLPTVAFTSPHVSCLNERWRIDGEPANWAVLAAAAGTVQAVLDQHPAELTWFERSFALAVVLAASRPGVHFLCEVGLGGRLDCANALDAAVVVITHLSHDHRDVLGPTLSHIAREKLAVARVGRPLVIAPQTPEGCVAIRACLPPEREAQWIVSSGEPVSLTLDGAHQQGNAAAALAAAAALYPALDRNRALAGMAGAGLAARCQVIEQPARRLLIDGAHNGPSLAATVAVAAARLRPGWRLILALASDKEVEEVLAAIPPEVIVRRCGYASPRARGAEAWPARALAWPWHADIGAALAAEPDADLCISGSLYLAGEALRALGHGGRLPG
jgi:dihydrofolate synthase/folylpolyglutamate synthase